MPGPFTHIYTARRVADFLRSDSVTDEFIRKRDGKLEEGQQLFIDIVNQTGRKQCAAAMDKWEKFTAVGAIGPDLFFFMMDFNTGVNSDEIMLAMSLLYWLDDQGLFDDTTEGLLTILIAVTENPWTGVLKVLLELWKIWKAFLEVWNRNIGPILDKVDQVIDDLTGQLLSALGDAISELKNAVIGFAEVEIFTAGDIMQWFSLKMRQGFDEQSYLWSDMLHYRRTSVFPARLFQKARGMLATDDKITKEHGEQLLAFTLGWVCHVGADVIAHSFVNEQCGGPFRTHWQRHHVIENHIDAWNYECTRNGQLPADPFVGFRESYPDLADSALYFAVQIPADIDTLPDEEKQGDHRQDLPQGHSRNEEEERKKLLDTDGVLPMWLAETISKVLIDVYAHPNEGADPDLQSPLHEGVVPHPLNLAGMRFQTILQSNTSLIEKWIGKLDVVDKVLKPADEVRQLIAPDPPAGQEPPPGFPLPWEIQASYRFMLSFFKRSYLSVLDMDKPEPPTIYKPSLNEIAEAFGPPDFSGVDPNDDPLSQGCEVVAALLDHIWKSLTAVANFIYELVKAAASAATILAREILYNAVTLPLWQTAEDMRMVLCHLGFLQPQALQLYANGNVRRPNEIDETILTLGHSVDSAFQQLLLANKDVLGNLDTDPGLTNAGVRPTLGAPNPWIPVRVAKHEKPPAPRWNATNVNEYQRPWAFPDRNNSKNPKWQGNYIETPSTLAGPYVEGTKPHQLLQLADEISNPARLLYQTADAPSTTDTLNETFILHHGNTIGFEGRNPLGDPIVFSTYLIGQIANNPHFLSSFNLDADRGYGYLCWDWERGTDDHPDEVDGRGRTFPLPKTWPEGSELSSGPLPHWKMPEDTVVSDANRYAPELKLVYTRKPPAPDLT